MEIEFYTICNWMRDDLKLSGTELDCYAVIYCLSQGDNRYIAGVKKLMQLLHKSEPCILSALKNLTEKGFVLKDPVMINKIKHYYYKAVRPSGDTTKESLGSTLKDLSDPTLKDLSDTYNIKDKNINKTLSKDNSKDELFEKFWADFGRKGSKANALKEWNKLKAKQKEIVLNKVSDYILFCKRSNRAKKDASSYLHQEYFNQEWNQIPDYYQPNEHDDNRISKFKRYMCDKFPDLIYHHNPLTFEQLDGLFGEYPVEVVEDAMRELSHRYIHQYYKVLDGINDIIKEREDKVL